MKDLVAREELRRSMEGILDLERLLSRVTLETANPRDLLALAAIAGQAAHGAHVACRTSPPSDCRRCTRSATSLPICARASSPRWKTSRR